MPTRYAKLDHPLLVQLEAGDCSGVSEGIDSVEKRVRHVVIVRRQLCFDSRDREEPANSNVEAIFDREVEVEILQNRIEAVLFVGLQELLAEVALRGREAIVDTVESRHVVSPVEMGVLHCVGEAFDIYDRLVEFDLVGKNVVGDREVILCRGAEIEAAGDPSVHFRAAVFEVQCRH